MNSDKKILYREYKKLAEDNSKLCRELENDFKLYEEEMKRERNKNKIARTFGSKMLTKYYYWR